MKRQNKTDDTQPTSISRANTLEEIADFWDYHSLDECWEQTYEVEFEVRASRRRVDGNARAKPEELPLTEAQIEELDRRVATYSENPNEGIAWEDFRQQFRAKP